MLTSTISCTARNATNRRVEPKRSIIFPPICVAATVPRPSTSMSSLQCRDDMLVAILLLACDCVGEDALACLFRGIDGQLGDVYVGWLLKHLDDDKRDLLCL